MTKLTIFIGSDRIGYPALQARIAAVLAPYGFSIAPVLGCWTDAEGTVVEEISARIEVYAETPEIADDATALAIRLAADIGEDSILVDRVETPAYFVSVRLATAALAG